MTTSKKDQGKQDKGQQDKGQQQSQPQQDETAVGTADTRPDAAQDPAASQVPGQLGLENVEPPTAAQDKTL
jgi:hypothetical protein